MVSGDCLCVFQVPGIPFPQKNHPSSLEKETFSKKIRDTYLYQPMAFPIFLQIYFYMPIAPLQNKKIHSGDLHTLLPNLDSCIKFVMNALSGIVWKNEKFISGLQACKIFDENPHTIIRVLDAKTVKVKYKS